MNLCNPVKVNYIGHRGITQGGHRSLKVLERSFNLAGPGKS